MENKKIIQDEELLYSLPDYVNGKIYDDKLREEIERKINSDSEFRSEYLSVKDALQFVKDSSLDEPPEHYFNNLVPRLNERIEKGKSGVMKDYMYLLHLWRYIVPALTVILVIIIVAIPRKDKKEVIIAERTDSQNTVLNNSGSIIETPAVTPDTDDTQIIQQSETPVIIKYNVSKKETKIEKQNIIENITDLIYDTDESSGDENEEYNYESDFKSLTPAEQNEVLANLSKTKF